MSQSSSTPALAYIHTSTATEQRRLERRTAAIEGAFFLPHLRSGMRLIDCGCGVGSITVGMAEAVAPGEVVGIDIQPGQIERARNLAHERAASNVRFEVGSVYELPFPDGAFDAAFAYTVVHHLVDPLRALREMRRVLAPGGVIGIADDDHATLLWEPETPLVRQCRSLISRVMEHYGGHPYLARGFRALLLEAGFVRAEVPRMKVDCYGTPEETRWWAAVFVDQLLGPAIADVVTGEGWADQATLEAIAAEVLAWGERPDALFALMSCTAVGWAPG